MKYDMTSLSSVTSSPQGERPGFLILIKGLTFPQSNCGAVYRTLRLALGI